MPNEWVLEYDQLISRAIRLWTIGAPREEWEDLRQECYLHLLKKQAAIQAKLKGWTPERKKKYISLVLKRKLLDLVKCKKILTRAEPKTLSLTEVGSRISQKPANQRITERISALPVNEQIALELRYEHSMTHAEVAKSMGLSVRQVQRIHKKAIAKLRQETR